LMVVAEVPAGAKEECVEVPGGIGTQEATL
jgi:hypothetical protein